MSKYGLKVYPSEIINTKNHWAVGTVWSAVGSKGTEYKIEMQNAGFSCDCPAFKKCKHIKQIEENF
jgi:hypothetical protein